MKKGTGTKTAKDRTAHTERNQAIIEQHLRGDTYYTIGKRYGITQARVSHIVKQARLEWQAMKVADFSLFATEELQRIQRLENAAHLAFIKSCLPKIRLVEPKDKKMTKAQREKFYKDANAEKDRLMKELKALPLHELILRDEARMGEIRLFDTVMRCIDRRIKLLGLDAPDRIALEGKDGKAIEVSVKDPAKELKEFNGLPLAERLKYFQDRLAGRN